ncbi:amidohydrolase [Mycolicibacterium phlei]|jgi:amidohydrolase|uniref:N-acyl-L-amino acid amidohydrolase n=1 Tax=Mycolicibacterium phlei DSM 43239 = CCUG 21000 TaxID=1226750 RepID=A0A5N5V3V9_MYCPH|nr:M20 family metallopeptidase [Mycolicibacterium phlei]VEG08468.1 amidohydrolase [Mycobacteroides chelonae]AMO60348.1 putative hydrolase YxeP [Mycolicibacterium phlei]EID17767.1 amidohydrolase [Mycolicibacterium phlei RIVM601174]KAB7756612.1 N-acyl-L-amino acid amidohydrolase [Mycolicibacterium phlei DSM 43239 = CCUG 21000]KXW62043.1 N-acyl-L-amino acid amidohydrolase [Mycolicibacterium phlei DSM 43072]
MSVLPHAAARWLSAHFDDLVEWRRHIHRHPELGRQEFATTQFVASKLAEAGLNPKVLPGGTGLTCDLGPDDGQRIALRADMDALPMPDRSGAPYASLVPNVAHACGHDGHTAILLGTALALASVPELPVGVRLIFQAAEELMPGGALDAIAAGALTGVSRIFALHCDPRLAVGKVAVRQGPITSAADQLEVTLHSPGGHTSRPHLTGDLVYGLGTLITGVPGVLSRRIDPRNSTVMVWGAVNAGVAANAIPQTGTLAGTIRTASRDTWVTLESIMREIISSLLAPLGLEHTVQYRRGVPPVVNEEISTRILTHAIESIGPDVLADTRQSGGGEDFSWYLEEVPGAMARLGVWSGRGPQLDLHQPTFDLDERALAIGVRLMVNIVDQAAQL